jgi:hypothetical protein
MFRGRPVAAFIRVLLDSWPQIAEDRSRYGEDAVDGFEACLALADDPFEFRGFGQTKLAT